MNLSAFIVALAFANASAGGYGYGGYGQIAGGYPTYVANPTYGRYKRDAAPGGHAAYAYAYGIDSMADSGEIVAIKAAPAPNGYYGGRRKRDATPSVGYDAMEEVPCVGYAGDVCLYAGYGAYGGAHQIGKRAAADSLYAGRLGAGHLGYRFDATGDTLYAGLGRAHQIGKRAAAPRYGYDAMADTVYAGYPGAPAIAPAAIPAAYRRKRDAPVADESIAPAAYAHAYANAYANAYAYAY